MEDRPGKAGWITTGPVGSTLQLVPGHCDPTVNMYNEFVCVRDGVVEDVWPIDARGPG